MVTVKQKIVDTLIFFLFICLAAFLADSIVLRLSFSIALLVAVFEIQFAATKICDPERFLAAKPFVFAVSIALLLACAVNLFVHLGPEEYILFFVTISAADAGAMLVGSLFGTKKVMVLQKISPNKSYFGYFGEILSAWLFGVLTLKLLAIPAGPATIIFIITAPIVATLGDLLGSLAKRHVGIKDSGALLRYQPGFRLLESIMRSRNGYLDCFDSLSLGFILFVVLRFTLH